MKRYAHLALFLVVVLLIAACGGSDVPTLDTGENNGAASEGGDTSEQTDATADGVVTVTFGVQEFRPAQYEALAEQFNAENSDMQVQLVSLDSLFEGAGGFEPDQMLRKIVSATDTAAPFYLTRSAIEKGYVQDLQPLMDADPDFDEDDFYDAALGSHRVDGGTYMLPYMMPVSLLNYNQSLWQGAGLPEPAPDWTWNDITAAAEELAQQRGDEVDVYGLIEMGGHVTLIAELEAAGIDLFSTPTAELQLDDPAFVEAMEHTQTLVESGAVYAPAPIAVDTTAMQELVQNQQAAMWMSNMVGEIDPADLDFEIGTAPLPPSPLFWFGNAQGYVMSSGTQHPQEAWRWLDFLSRQILAEHQAMIEAGGTRQVPARKSIAETSGYWDQLGEERAAAVRATLQRQPEPLAGSRLHPEQPSPFKAINTALEEVLSNEATPQQALNEAQATLDEQIAEAQQTPEPEGGTGPIVVATPVVE
jgi:multiple sugar transport system substrate-binding protein